MEKHFQKAHKDCQSVCLVNNLATTMLYECIPKRNGCKGVSLDEVVNHNLKWALRSCKLRESRRVFKKILSASRDFHFLCENRLVRLKELEENGVGYTLKLRGRLLAAMGDTPVDHNETRKCNHVGF